MVTSKLYHVQKFIFLPRAILSHGFSFNHLMSECNIRTCGIKILEAELKSANFGVAVDMSDFLLVKFNEN